MESQCRTWLTTPSGDDATLWQKSSATDLYWRILTKRKDFESDTDRLDWLIFESEDDFESDTDRLPDVHVQQLLPLGGEEEGEAKRGALVIVIVMTEIEMSIIIILMIVIECYI